MTHTTKHTPGPWGVDATGQVCKRAANGSWDLIAYLDESPYYPDKFANAALIAAAPAMYADAKQLCELVRDFMNDNRLYDGQVIQAISNLETALSQAEGRQS